MARFGAPTNVVQALNAMQSNDVVYMGQAPLRVDFLLSIDGVSLDQLFERAVQTTLDGVRVKVISLDDLIANKRAAGRPQDLLDAAFLEQVQRH